MVVIYQSIFTFFLMTNKGRVCSDPLQSSLQVFASNGQWIKQKKLFSFGLFFDKKEQARNVLGSVKRVLSRRVLSSVMICACDLRHCYLRKVQIQGTGVSYTLRTIGKHRVTFPYTYDIKTGSTEQVAVALGVCWD